MKSHEITNAICDIGNSIINFMYKQCEILPSNIQHSSSTAIVPSEEDKDIQERMILLDKARSELGKIFSENNYSIDKIIELTCEKTLDIKCGNCHELSYLFFYLAKQYYKEYPIELFFTDEHMFIAINRQKWSNPNNPDTWGETCVIADPWGKKMISLKEFMAYRNHEKNDPYYSLALAGDIQLLHGNYPEILKANIGSHNKFSSDKKNPIADEKESTNQERYKKIEKK